MSALSGLCAGVEVVDRDQRDDVLPRHDAAVTERLLIVEANETIPPEQRNPFLDDDLAAEAEQILTWMVKQAVRW